MIISPIVLISGCIWLIVGGITATTISNYANAISPAICGRKNPVNKYQKTFIVLFWPFWLIKALVKKINRSPKNV